MSVLANSKFEDSITFDKAIKLTGYGRFHYEVCSVCALCILSVGFQNGLSSYVFQSAQSDLNIQPKDVGLLNVGFLIGGTLSAFLWGVIADLNGRKHVLLITLILDSLVTILCSLMRTFTGVMVCRALNGFLIGCPGSVTLSYLAEFHAPEHRARSICYSGISFTAAWAILPLVAYLVLPIDIDINLIPGVPYQSWRLFLIIMAIPEAIAGLWLLHLPESPKFLLDKDDAKGALEVLKQIYAKNNRESSEEYPVKKLPELKKHIDLDNLRCRGKTARIIDDVCSQMMTIFCAPLRHLTLLLSVITFSNMFGFFGLGLWLPEIFIRFEQHQKLHPNETITIKDLSFTKENTTLNSDETFDTTVFVNTLIVAASALVGNIVSGLLAGKIHVKTIAAITMFFGSLSSACIYWIRSSTEILIVSSVFQAAMATANMVLGSVVIEIFPTCVGAVALSMSLCTGRIGAICSNVLFSVLINKHSEVIIFLVSGILLVGTLLCIIVPKSRENGKINKEREDNSTSDKLQIEISVISISDNCNVTITAL